MKTCSSKHCKHKDVPLEEFGCCKVGNLYYHPDCYREMQCIKNIVTTWATQVDKDPVYSQLRNTINTIVYKKQFPAEKLLFYLRWAIKTGWPIKHPPGLFYLIKDSAAERAWQNRKPLKYYDGYDFEIIENKNAYAGFSYKPQQTGFTRIIG